MNDQPKLWERKERGRVVYYVTIDGKQHRLGRDKAEAETEYQKLVGQPSEPSLTVKRLADKFHKWNEQHRPASAQWYKGYIDKFVEEFGIHQASVIQRKSLTKWADETFTSDHGKEGAHRAVQRMYNWAVKEDHLSVNKLRGAERPRGEPRQDYLTPEQFKQLLEHVPEDDPFRDILTVAWLTGARPQELRKAEARHLVNGSLVFPKAEAKGKKRARTIVLLGESLDIVKRLCKQFPDGPIFRYQPKGGKDSGQWKGYTSYALCDRFKRLKKDSGWDGRLCAYMLRHSYATNVIVETDTEFAEVAALMGHRDSTMVENVYGHHRERADYMRRIAEKAAQGLKHDS